MARHGGNPVYAVEEVATGVPPPVGREDSPAELSRGIRYVSVHEQHVYVAGSDGCVYWYTTRGQQHAWALEGHARVSSSGKPVDKVLVLAAVRTVAVLCECTLRFFAFPTLAPVAGNALAPIRGVIQVVGDDGEPRGRNAALGFGSLCVVKRQSLLLVMVEKQAWGRVKEVPISRDAVIACRYNEVVCIATPSEYRLVNLDSGMQTPLGLPISQSTDVSSAAIRPCIAAFGTVADAIVDPAVHAPTSCVFLITSHADAGTLGAFLRADGEPTDMLIEWPSHPRAVVANYPYVCALLRNNTIHVHDLRTLQLVQTLPVPEEAGPRLLLPTEANGALLNTASSLHVVVHVPWGFTGGASTPLAPLPAAPQLPHAPLAAVSSVPMPRIPVTWAPVHVLLVCRRSVACVAQRTAASRAVDAVAAGDGTAAEEIVRHAWDGLPVTDRAALTPETSQLRAVALLLGVLHVQQARFPTAARLLAIGRIDVRFLVAKFPRFRGLLSDDAPHATMPELASHAWSMLPGSVEELVDANLAMNYSPPLEPEHAAIVTLRAQLVRRAEKMLADVVMDAIGEHGKGEGAVGGHAGELFRADAVGASGTHDAQTDVQEQIKMDTGSKSSPVSPTNHPISRGGRHSPPLSSSQSLRDTYTIPAPESPTAHSAADLAPIPLRSDPHVDIASVRAHLSYCTPDALAAELMRAHRYVLYAEALLLHGMRMHALRILRRVVDGEYVDVQDSASLRDVASVVASITGRAEADKYGLWLARHDASMGLAVLVRVEYDTGTDSRATIDALRKIDADTAHRLLEHVVLTSPQQAADLHTVLCDALVEDVVGGVSDEHAGILSAYTHSDRTETFPAFIARAVRRGDTPVARVKLLILLAYSRVLDHRALLATLAAHDELLFEQAMVLSYVGRKHDALRLLAAKVRDYHTTEIFCAQGGCAFLPALARSLAHDAGIDAYARLVDDRSVARSDERVRAELLNALLAIYMEPGAADEFRTPTAYLLTKQTQQFDTVDVLNAVPRHWPVADLRIFLLRKLRQQLHDRRHAQVVKSVAMAQSLDVAEQHWTRVRALGGVIQDEDLALDAPADVPRTDRTPPPALDVAYKHAFDTPEKSNASSRPPTPPPKTEGTAPPAAVKGAPRVEVP
ncbi:hypothetical protein MSPP1_003511 [Malassezia sp. CBS 17886]|nr:hypothetical protein MSPP1_003511 [Malassezia sp. CBS 17886]